MRLKLCLAVFSQYFFFGMAASNFAGFSSVIDKAESENLAVFAGNKLWIFGQKFFQQPTYNWGHRVIYQGSYALSFDVATQKWDKVEYPGVSEDENLTEALFVYNDEIYLLIGVQFNDNAVKGIYRWTGTQFAPLKLQAPALIPGDPENRRQVEYFVAEGTTKNGKKILVRGGSQTANISTLAIDGDTATVEHFYDVPADATNLHSWKPLYGVVQNGNLALAYGVHGCGFRIEISRLIIVDLDKKTAHENHEFTDNGDGNPRWGFTGSSSQALLPNGDWVQTGGSYQVGMSGSQFDNGVWVLKDATGSSPTWKKLPITIESGSIAFDAVNNALYVASASSLNKFDI